MRPRYIHNLVMGILLKFSSGDQTSVDLAIDLSKLQSLRWVPASILGRAICRPIVTGCCRSSTKSYACFRCPHSGRWRHDSSCGYWSCQRFCIRASSVLRIICISLLLLLQRVRSCLLEIERVHSGCKITANELANVTGRWNCTYFSSTDASDFR